MLSQTISSICKHDDSIGLCDHYLEGTRHAHHQIDIRYSFLIIDLLMPVYKQTAFFLF
jgi:hypothetical protein